MASQYTPYVCKLDAATQKKAQDELNEDPKNRQGAIDAFRDWIKQQKHMKCPIDDVFLLGFLRAKHFSQLEAREALERFMTHRDKLPKWMKNTDTKEKRLEQMMRTGNLFILPHRDQDNHRVGMMRPGANPKVDVTKELMELYGRYFATLGYYNYLCDEMTQVHGSVSISDWTGHTLAKEMKIPMEMKKNMTAMITKAFPARLKGYHMYNTGALMEVMMGIINVLMPEKLKKRMHIHHHGLESIYEYIPMQYWPEDYLPDDYKGPNAGSIESIVSNMVVMLQSPEIRDRIKYLSSDEFYINIKEKDTAVPVASFRKLNVD